ncbi:MAG: cell division/cell wall cluster transcriptional repressor MraZ [Actinomycetota bacterium]
MGSFERNLDDKGRLALPAAYRDRLGEHCYLAIGPDKCVNVVPAAVFEEEAAILTARVRAGEVPRNQARALASSAVLANLDKQGRINIDEQLRTYAGLALGTTVTVAGNFDRLEIWATERFARVSDEGTERLAGDDE